MTDNSIMPFGKYKGEKMANIPAKYLIWLYENLKWSDAHSYIRANEDVLREEIKRQELEKQK